MRAFGPACLQPERLGRWPRTVFPLSMAWLLAACGTAPFQTAPSIQVPVAYKEVAAVQMRWQAAQPAEAQPTGQWWRVFNDPTLDALQQQADPGSPVLIAAAARTKAARAALQGAEADRLPQVNVLAGVTRQAITGGQAAAPSGTRVPPATTWQLGLEASYQMDLFQRAANGARAAEADAQASEALLRAERLDLQANVAQAYYQLRTLDAEVNLLTRSRTLRDHTLGLIEKLYSAGTVSELDLTRAQTDRASTQTELQGAQSRRRVAEHALALLLGQAPAAFEAPPMPLPADQYVPQVPPGVPSALLERRPDVAAAQARMAAAHARVGQARSALFPAVVLSARGGQTSAALADLFAASARGWLMSMLASLPLIDSGRNRAAITRAEAALEESAAEYRQSVLQAFGEVESHLASLDGLRAQVQTADEALAAARRSTELAGKRYRAGEDSYLTLLDAQRNLLSIERQSVQLRGLLALRTVGLVRALGGGW
jgi:outer membrane protein, multidrug efflux system